MEYYSALKKEGNSDTSKIWMNLEDIVSEISQSKKQFHLELNQLIREGLFLLIIVLFQYIAEMPHAYFHFLKQNTKKMCFQETRFDWISNRSLLHREHPSETGLGDARVGGEECRGFQHSLVRFPGLRRGACGEAHCHCFSPWAHTSASYL